MEENLEIFEELIGRLKSGNRSTFRNDLELLAQELQTFRSLDDVEKLSYGSYRPSGDLMKLISENEEFLRVCLELIKEPGQSNKLWNLVFHTTRQVGTKYIPHIREEWKRDSDARGINNLHRCLMDIIATRLDEEDIRLKPIIAEQEIPLWSEMLRTDTTKSRGLIAVTLGALAELVPARRKEVGELIMSLLYVEDDGMAQTCVVEGLLHIGDQSLLQDALFRLARVAREPYRFEFLVSALKRMEIDINTKDESGKTALTYANDLGNEKLAEVLKNAGAVE